MRRDNKHFSILLDLCVFWFFQKTLHCILVLKCHNRIVWHSLKSCSIIFFVHLVCSLWSTYMPTYYLNLECDSHIYILHAYLWLLPNLPTKSNIHMQLLHNQSICTFHQVLTNATSFYLVTMWLEKVSVSCPSLEAWHCQTWIRLVLNSWQ